MGSYIVLEGLEGCGKTTQAALLKTYCEENGIDYLHVRQPGSTPLAEGVRKLLLHGETVSARSEFMLMLSCWVDTHLQVILPALKAGKVVISERGFSALFAYQLYGRQLINTLDVECVLEMVASLFTTNEIADIVNAHVVEHCIYLEQPFERSLANMHKRLRETDQGFDRIEQESEEFFKRVQNGLEIYGASDSPLRDMLSGFKKHTIDISRHGIDTVHQQLVQILEEARA